MPLIGTYREASNAGIVDFSGSIALGEGTAMLRKMVREMVVNGKRNILLNLAEVNYIDSAGIGELVACHTTVRNAGGELKLLHLTKRIRELIQITRLYTIFDIQTDEAAALRSFHNP